MRTTLPKLCYALACRVAEESGRYSYASIVRGELGKVCSAILRMAIILNCAGVIVIYLVVIADSLAGDTQGLLPSLGLHITCPDHGMRPASAHFGHLLAVPRAHTCPDL